MDPYEAWKRHMLELGYDEAHVDQLVAQMRLEDEAKESGSEAGQSAARRTPEDD